MKHAQPHCTYTPLIALSLSLLLAACGGADNSNSSASNSSAARTENASNTPITVTGADQASVSYQPYGDRQTAATIRVARDGTGAPPLGEHYTAVSAVYQFTPLGWTEQAIDIRLPLPSGLGCRPSRAAHRHA
jgi:hypothetical protein